MCSGAPCSNVKNAEKHLILNGDMRDISREKLHVNQLSKTGMTILHFLVDIADVDCQVGLHYIAITKLAKFITMGISWLNML